MQTYAEVLILSNIVLIFMKDPVKLLVISYVPEIAYDKKNLENIANKIDDVFKSVANKYDQIIESVKIIEINRALVLKELENIAKYLELPNHKAIVYYFGHGDQVNDISGDEIDGKDEIWKTQNILDDEISIIFNNIHEKSMLTLFSDSCSSGSMIDIYYNKKTWVSISSSNDVQDSLSTSDGGVFTLFGLIPALENLDIHTPRNIHDYIKKNMCISSQTSILNVGNDKVIDKNIFIV